MDDKQRFEVILEEINEKFDILAEGQNVIVADIAGLKGGVAELKDKVDNLEGRLEQVEYNTRDLQAIREKQIEHDKRFANHENLNVQYKKQAT
jgi:uncharacterized protein (DUF3084 family)